MRRGGRADPWEPAVVGAAAALQRIRITQRMSACVPVTVCVLVCVTAYVTGACCVCCVLCRVVSGSLRSLVMIVVYVCLVLRLCMSAVCACSCSRRARLAEARGIQAHCLRCRKGNHQISHQLPSSSQSRHHRVYAKVIIPGCFVLFPGRHACVCRQATCCHMEACRAKDT